MQANELRLGNLVWNSTQQIPVRVNLKILSEQYYRQKSGKGLWEPIPLTEEWLKRFGFKYSERAEMWHLGINPITKDWLFTLRWLSGEQEAFYNNGFFKIKHVHQLQNLYFALTGEELQIEE